MAVFFCDTKFDLVIPDDAAEQIQSIDDLIRWLRQQRPPETE